MGKDVELFIVLPCYNEEEILPASAEKMMRLLQKLVEDGTVSAESRLLFVDDGSKDRTWELIEGLHEKHPVCSGIRLSRNRGHQIAIYSGMVYAVEQGADCVITIDADLQQDIRAIPDFLKQHAEGCDIVYGVRKSRDTDRFLKRQQQQCTIRSCICSAAA